MLKSVFDHFFLQLHVSLCHRFTIFGIDQWIYIVYA